MAEIYPMTTESEDIGWYSNEAATFGDRVAAGREALGLSQEGLAKRLGIKLKTLQNWEYDVSEPRANKLQMLSGVLNVSLVWLLTGEGEGLDEPTDAALSPDLTSVLTELREMRLEASKATARLGRLEKRLRKALEVQGT